MFVLKGAQMLRVWKGPETRPTMDIDLLGKTENDIETIKQMIRECCLLKIDDGVNFDTASITAETIRQQADYQGVRVFAKGSLGSIRLNLQIDIGFGDAVIPEPVWVELPQLLDFGRPVLLGYTPESAIAEKFQAMVVLDVVNTRMKDFYDIWLLSETIELNISDLTTALRETFARRKTPLPNGIPTFLTTVFTEDEAKKQQWQAFLRKIRSNQSVSLNETAAKIATLILPLITTDHIDV